MNNVRNMEGGISGSNGKYNLDFMLDCRMTKGQREQFDLDRFQIKMLGDDFEDVRMVNAQAKWMDEMKYKNPDAAEILGVNVRLADTTFERAHEVYSRLQENAASTIQEFMDERSVDDFTQAVESISGQGVTLDRA